MLSGAHGELAVGTAHHLHALTSSRDGGQCHPRRRFRDDTTREQLEPYLTFAPLQLSLRREEERHPRRDPVLGVRGNLVIQPGLDDGAEVGGAYQHRHPKLHDQ